MKNPNYRGIELLPLSVIEAARAGDAEAVERVLRYYEGYINKLCTRTLYDEYGQPHVCVPLRYNNDKRKKPLFSRGSRVCRHLFNSFSKLKSDEKNIKKRRLFH